MFDAGLSEFVLIFVIALLILGPERLPRVAAQIGRWIGRARRTANQLRMQIEREMTLDDIKRDQKKREEQKSKVSDQDTSTTASDEDTQPQSAEGADDDDAYNDDRDHSDAGADDDDDTAEYEVAEISGDTPPGEAPSNKSSADKPAVADQS